VDIERKESFQGRVKSSIKMENVSEALSKMGRN